MNTLLDALQLRVPGASRQKLRRLLERKLVTVNGQVTVVASTPVGGKDVVVIRDAVPQPTARPPVPIVYEDDALLVVDKPAGLLTSTTPREKRPTLVAKLQALLTNRDGGEQLGLIHRLDRDASGLLVFAKHAAAFDSLKGQFYRHSVERRYVAVVNGVPEPAAGTIDSRLVELADGRVVETRRRDAGQHAVTHFEMTRAGRARAMLNVRLETGRKHQIRTHLASIGHPIVGDPIYGRADSNQNLMLRAVVLELSHPRDGRRMRWSLEVPAEFERAIEA